MSIQTIEKIISRYFQNQPVIKAWIFGSFARSEETPLSDVDILVEYQPGGVSLLKHISIMCDLEKLLGRQVDLVQAKLLRSNVVEKINQDKKLIYERGS